MAMGAVQLGAKARAREWPWAAGVVRVGSRRFDVLEPPRSSAEAPYTPC